MLMDLYVVGYFLLDVTFRNCVVDTLLKSGDKYYTYPGYHTVGPVWEKIPPNARMRELIINHWANRVEVPVSILTPTVKST